jgi:preprotein translocase SecE subunit
VAKSKSRATSTSSGEPNAVVKYFQDTRAELRRVTWPTRDETRTLTTVIVILFQVVVAGVISGDMIRVGLAVVLFLGGTAAFYYNSQDV